MELKYLFSKESQYTKEVIYVIKEAENMNKEASNTILKFLEEPSDNVIGFFLTKDKNNIISTIQSRCQIIEVVFDNTISENLGITDSEYQNYLEIIVNYLRQIEEDNDAILMNKEIVDNYEKKDIVVIVQIILEVYKTILEKKKNDQLLNQLDFLNKLSYNNVERKVNLIIEILNEIKFNVNIQLLLDRFVLEMESINNESI